jgi:tetratricopeptide (TPR) repeat protein/O-antigen ligase
VTVFRRALSPAPVRLVQLAVTLLVVQYMLLIGAMFGASIFYSAQRLNLLGGAGLALAWLLVRVGQRRSLSLTGLEPPLLIFGASQWLAVFTSIQPRLGLDWAASVTTWIAFFFILADLLAAGWPRVYWINALIVAAIILAADGVWSAAQWFTSWVALGSLPLVTFRYYGLLGHANLTACVINLLWPIVVAKMILPVRPVARLALGALAAALAITSFFTSSRAGWLAAGAGLIVLIVMLGYAHGARLWVRAWQSTWVRWGPVAKLTAIGGLLLSAVLGAWLLAKQSQQITHGSIFEARQHFWSVAWDLFKSRPLTGVGPDLYPWYYSRYTSIPPDFFAPHAHSVIMQMLSGSGILGLGSLLLLAGAAAVRLWRQWIADGRPVETACLAAALVSFGVHLLFDFPVTPITFLLIVIILALALAPLTPTTEEPRHLHPLVAAPFLLLPIGVFAWLLQGSASNSAAIDLADAGQWQAAARAFEQSAQADPHMTLYWEEAAYAYTSAGEIQTALPLWERAAQDDPNWALLPATIGALKQDLGAAQAARTLAPGSHLFALNAGAIAEAQGNTVAAQETYRTALSLKPAIADALYWQQNPLRLSILRDWRNGLPATSSALDKGWAALTRQAPDQAVGWFQQAAAEDPSNLAADLGLGKAYLQLRDLNSAQRAVQTGLELPVTSLEELLPLYLLAGDVDDARGDRAGAISEYARVFSGIADYDIDGPGSYAHPQRSWFVFHRQALPGELVPQLPRADITAEMDQRFAKLAEWYRADGQTGLACWVLQRVHQEAPVSVSGALYPQQCPAS